MLLIIYAASKIGCVCMISEGPGENNLLPWDLEKRQDHLV